MDTTLIKICGVRDKATIDHCIANGVSHLGFMHFAKSKRHLPLDQIAVLAGWTSGRAKRVLIAVNPDDELLSAVAKSGAIDILQLHGGESVDRIADIAQKFPQLQLWKVISVRDAADIASAAQFKPLADMILFDAKTPENAALPGGMGVSFDWSLLARYSAENPEIWGLSGGLDDGNVGQALAATHAPLIDVSSGVEDEPGIKSLDKITRFCQAIQHYDRHK